jgi:hypothetical protein
MINGLPIPEIKPHDREKLVSYVDRILATKHRDAEADVSALEREIDRLVCVLYGLTPAEIQVVQGTAE